MKMFISPAHHMEAANPYKAFINHSRLQQGGSQSWLCICTHAPSLSVHYIQAARSPALIQSSPPMASFSHPPTRPLHWDWLVCLPHWAL